jgi:hypothetical protein
MPCQLNFASMLIHARFSRPAASIFGLSSGGHGASSRRDLQTRKIVQESFAPLRRHSQITKIDPCRSGKEGKRSTQSLMRVAHFKAHENGAARWARAIGRGHLFSKLRSWASQ